MKRVMDGSGQGSGGSQEPIVWVMYTTSHGELTPTKPVAVKFLQIRKKKSKYKPQEAKIPKCFTQLVCCHPGAALQTAGYYALTSHLGCQAEPPLV